MILSILTGSHAYGTPTSESDVDIVMLVDQKAFDLLMMTAGGCDGSAAEAFYYGTASLRFGKLNVIATLHASVFSAWRLSTDELIASKPVTRDEAAAHIGKSLAEAQGKFVCDDAAAEVIL